MTDEEIDALIEAKLNARLKTVRIPELTENTLPLSGEDRIPIWNAAENKTRKETLADLALFLALGGDPSTTPADTADKGSIVFDLTQPMIDAGDGKTIYLPQYAGKNFLLGIDGFPYKDAEYEVLNSGGFKVLKTLGSDPETDRLFSGMRIEMRFAEKIATGPLSSSGGFISGIVETGSNTTLTADDANKIIQIRGGNNQITNTLPEISGLPANSFFYFEAIIGNDKENKIQTQGGQSIYLNNTSYSAIYIRPGQSVLLVPQSDGWYVIDNAFSETYLSLGQPFASFKSTLLNELVLDGSIKNRADYPRLWEAVQTFGLSLINEADLDQDKIGCYTRGDGSTTFRLPDFRNVAIRSLKPSDAERTYNNAGGFQVNSVKTTDLSITTKIRNGSGGSGTNPLNAPTSGFSGTDNLGSWLDDTTSKTWLDLSINNPNSGTETRMDNIGMYWKIKV